MTALRFALLACAILLAATIIWAAFHAPFWASFGHITANPWGVVTLVDLYSGFLVSCVMLWLLEPRKGLAAALMTLALGNIVTLLWLPMRGLGFFRERSY